MPGRQLQTAPAGRASAVIPAGLSFRNLSKSFGAREVIRGVDLEVKPAEVVCLLGPSGCGKTTLLRIVAGIEEPTSGELAMDGIVISSPSGSLPPERRGVGLVFQDYALFPQMTVLENVGFGLHDVSKAERRATAVGALARVGLESHAMSYPYMLSGGEQQRVALARAIVPRPRVLLMDEPFSNLDRRMRDAVREDTVSLLRETGATCIMVTHDPEEAMRVADRVVLIREGRIVQAATPEDIYRRPVDLATARFFCDLNEMSCRIGNHEASTPLGRFAAEGLPEGEGVVCIRPQGIRILPAGVGGWPARIRSRRFLGETWLVEIDVPGLGSPLQARVRERPPESRRRDAAIEIDPQEVLVFGGAPA
ncbi:MAG: ABC transporter ATP-binding protein [Beijerinckiaceae bacterium]